MAWKTCPNCYGRDAGRTLPFDQDHCSGCNGRGEVPDEDESGEYDIEDEGRG